MLISITDHNEVLWLSVTCGMNKHTTNKIKNKHHVNLIPASFVCLKILL